MKKSQQIKKMVSEFYNELPFNYRKDSADHVNKIKESNHVSDYKDLDRLLRRPRLPFVKTKIKNALEIGCGTGWFANSLAYYYGVNVKAIDMTEEAVERSKKVAGALNLDNVDYVVQDLFVYEDQAQYDLVGSFGVLHHTYDCKEAFFHISNFVKREKYIYVGLYHSYGRKVFLE
jgi:2-polyprenyl-3-methyl-5-hydroxy-6-metoxy-1,4-benzoquinol methylase